jgi:hypothetical protein
MISATCHCGAVRIEVPERPQALRRFDGAETWTYLD